MQHWQPHIPYDMYESPQEILLVFPLGGVKKDSLQIHIQDYRLIIQGERMQLDIKENFIPIKQECYRWSVWLQIDLPPYVYFEKIHSKLTPENTLHVIIPKAIIPEKIALEIEYEA